MPTNPALRRADEEYVDTVEELNELDERPICPYCGEQGGEPRMVRSREFQGNSAHGGMVEWEDEGCSLCIRRHDGI